MKQAARWITVAPESDGSSSVDTGLVPGPAESTLQARAVDWDRVIGQTVFEALAGRGWEDPGGVNTGFILDTITGLDLTHPSVDRRLLSAD